MRTEADWGFDRRGAKNGLRRDLCALIGVSRTEKLHGRSLIN